MSCPHNNILHLYSPEIWQCRECELEFIPKPSEEQISSMADRLQRSKDMDLGYSVNPPEQNREEFGTCIPRKEPEKCEHPLEKQGRLMLEAIIQNYTGADLEALTGCKPQGAQQGGERPQAFWKKSVMTEDGQAINSGDRTSKYAFWPDHIEDEIKELREDLASLRKDMDSLKAEGEKNGREENEWRNEVLNLIASPRGMDFLMKFAQLRIDFLH